MLWSEVKSLSHVRLFATPWTVACQAPLSMGFSRQEYWSGLPCPTPGDLPDAGIEPMSPTSSALQVDSLPSEPPREPFRPDWFSSVQLLSCVCNIRPSNEHSGLISFRMDWLDLLAVQGTLKSLLQHHGSKSSILRRSAFFIVQLSHPYMTTGETIALTRQIFVDKVMSLLFNMLSRLTNEQNFPKQFGKV